MKKQMAITALIIMALVLPAAVAEEPVDLSLPGEWYASLIYSKDYCMAYRNEDGYTYSSSTVLFEISEDAQNIRLTIHEEDGDAEVVDAKYLHVSDSADLIYRIDGQSLYAYFLEKQDNELNKSGSDRACYTLSDSKKILFTGDMVIPKSGGETVEYLLSDGTLHFLSGSEYESGNVYMYSEDVFVWRMDGEEVKLGDHSIGNAWMLFIRASALK